MIKFEQVNKSYDRIPVLQDFNLHVPAGSVYALVGPNGAGKTSLIKILSGIYRQDSGSVRVEGEPVFENIPLKQRIIYISDELFFFSMFTIRDMANYYASVYPCWNWERFDQLSSLFAIDLNRRAIRLSKGMQRQVAFWLSMSAMPKVMILDEPMDGLDPAIRKHVWSVLLQDVAQRGLTILIASHNLRELEDVCDHVGIIYGGRMLLEKSLDEAKYNIHKLQVAPGVPLEDTPLAAWEILHHARFGSVHTLIVRGDRDELQRLARQVSPVVADLLPMTLEEVFIYELGGAGYVFSDLLLQNDLVQ
jgi:ABC-2 type transport system ATP-binding protein